MCGSKLPVVHVRVLFKGVGGSFAEEFIEALAEGARRATRKVAAEELFDEVVGGLLRRSGRSSA